MNKLTLVAPILLALSLAPSLAQAQPADFMAMDVLEKTVKTYAGFKEYKGKCVAISDSMTEPSEWMKRFNMSGQHLSVARSSIEYKRGVSFRIEANDGSQIWKAVHQGDEIYLQSEGNASMKIEPMRRDFESGPKKYPINTLCIWFYPHASQTGAITLMALENNIALNPIHSAYVPDDNVEMLPTQKINGTPCYVVARTKNKQNETTTLWIEQKTFLIRRIERKQGELKSEPTLIDGKTYEGTHSLYSYEVYAFSTEIAR